MLERAKFDLFMSASFNPRNFLVQKNEFMENMLPKNKPKLNILWKSIKLDTVFIPEKSKNILGSTEKSTTWKL